MATSSSMVDIGIHKIGPTGRPMASVVIDSGVSLDKLSSVLQKEVTRNTDLRKKLGLKACLACTSGMDLDIRHRFDKVLQVDLNRVG